MQILPGLPKMIEWCLADGLINISDLKTIMVEIGEEMNDQELNEMIKATGTLDGKGMFSLL